MGNCKLKQISQFKSNDAHSENLTKKWMINLPPDELVCVCICFYLAYKGSF